MARFAALLLTLVFYSGVSHTQETRYVSDKQYVPLRSGAGNEYRIIHRGLVSGTRLSVNRTSGDGEWTEVTSDAGLTGWIRSQYLMSEMPAQQRLSVATRKIEQSGEESADLSTQLRTLETERENLIVRLDVFMSYLVRRLFGIVKCYFTVYHWQPFPLSTFMCLLNIRL